MIVWREIEYLVKWKDYDSKYDVWRNLSKLNDVMNLIQKYENSIRHMIDLFDRHRLSKSIMLKKTFANQKIRTISKKFFLNQQSSTTISITISQSIFALRFLIIVSRKFFSIILLSSQTSLTLSFEALMLRRSSRLAKNWKISEEESLLEETHD